MFGAIKSWFGAKPEPKRFTATDVNRLMRQVMARYDAAQTTADNRRHWANADALSADAANSAEVRRILRNRARYEISNNSYARGIIDTIANDIIGTGPRLRTSTGDRELDRATRGGFDEWMQSVELPQKLRSLVRAWYGDGEGLASILDTDFGASEVGLDVIPFECDRLTSQGRGLAFGIDHVDGIELDRAGRPVGYWILPNHPGSASGAFGEPNFYLAPSVLHLFTADRPEQHRGIPKIAPALPLFAMLREFTLATLDAAKAAAYFTAILHTQGPASATEGVEVSALDEIEVTRNMMTTLPEGWDMRQFAAEHPNGTYAEFTRCVLREIARCLSVPYNVAAGDSSDYNYASGRLDHQTYFKSIRVARSEVVRTILDPLFRRWVRDAAMLPQNDGMQDVLHWRHKWIWDGHEHVDPLKEANATAKRLETRQETLADHFAGEGEDWEEQVEQMATERKKLIELGLISIAPVPSTETDNVPSTEDEDD